MRETLSEHLRLQELRQYPGQILDDWIQEPREDILFHVQRRSGASTLLRQAVSTHHGFHLENVGQGFQMIVCENTGKRFCMGTPTQGVRMSFEGFRHLSAIPCV